MGEDMILLLTKEGDGVFAQNRAKQGDKYKLKEYEEGIVKFVTDTQLDGAAFVNKKRNIFNKEVKAYLIGEEAINSKSTKRERAKIVWFKKTKRGECLAK